jgi:large exoprotein involved in heme utilization and adhesion
MSNGNGGDIQISVPTIVLNTAAIQANTAAPQALGGTVNINAVVIPSFDFVLLGGSLQQFDPTLLGLNLIQAAAPDGVSGTLNLTNPALDIGSSLLGLTGAPATRAVLGRSLCDFRHGSSLLTAGRGGLPTSARDPMWIDAEDFIRQPTTSENAPATDNHYLALSPIANSSIFGCR